MTPPGKIFLTMASSKIDISIIVVSYNTRAMTLECLESIFQGSTATEFEVLVIDNASSDGSMAEIEERFGGDERVRTVASAENLGFAKANNLLVESARGRYILLLNPDTVVLGDAVDSMFEFAESHPDYGIWGGRTVFADGSLNPTNCWGRFTLWSQFCRYSGLTRVFSQSRLFNPRAYVDWDRGSVKPVDIVTGCFFMMRTVDWNRFGGFDPAFFMYGEEVDLCMRAAKDRIFPIVTPDAAIIHHGGASEKILEDKWVRILGAERNLFARHWSWGSSELARLMTYAGLVLRGITAFVVASEDRNMWWALLRRRREWDSRV